MSDCSLEEHRVYGKWRVLYPDGQLSQPFGKRVAVDYVDIFGGKVVYRDYIPIKK